MKCRHIFEKRIYLISNKAVAGNCLFLNPKEQVDFMEKVVQYLDPICNILAHALHDDQFQLLIETKSRRSFTKLYRDNHRGKTNEEMFIPMSTHIFSRQMSNLQVSVAKKFNFRHERSGALFAARFERILVEDELELQHWLAALRNKKRLFKNAKKWVNQIRGESDEGVDCLFSTKGYLWRISGGTSINVGVPEGQQNNLGASFNSMLIPDHLHPTMRKRMLDFRRKHPCGPNYN